MGIIALLVVLVAICTVKVVVYTRHTMGIHPRLLGLQHVEDDVLGVLFYGVLAIWAVIELVMVATG